MDQTDESLKHFKESKYLLYMTCKRFEFYERFKKVVKSN